MTKIFSPVILFIIMLILQLTDVISWSWWIITLPLWLPVATFILTLIVVTLWAVVEFYYSKSKLKKKIK